MQRIEIGYRHAPRHHLVARPAHPVRLDRERETHQALDVRLLDEVGMGSTKLGQQAVEGPHRRPWIAARQHVAELLRASDVVRHVARPYPIELRCVVPHLCRELTQGLEHQPAPLDALEQRPLGQRPQPDVCLVDLAAHGRRRRLGVERRPEHGQVGEAPPLVVGEQVVRPLHRGGQRAVAVGRPTLPRQDAETTPDLAHDQVEVHRVELGGGQLDRQWQAPEVVAQRRQ